MKVTGSIPVGSTSVVADITLERIEQVTYRNPLAAYGQSGQISERDWEGSEGIDPTALFEGNTLLRGGMDVTTAMSQYLMIE